ncbi:MAG: nicotinamide riboside transporter PnuC [Bacteroidales bacterium]|nr:nicotinamide riboside transporter PnuC [Bacteroidales bacterium]
MVITWLSDNYIELLASVLGILYVILAIRQNIWCWMAGIINVALYIFIFLNARLYGDMALQVFYLLMSIYGWYSWKFGKSKNKEVLVVTRLTQNSVFLLLVILTILSVGFGYLLSFTNSDIPYWDGLTTALGLIATWMIARKIIENWLVWIFTDLLCVGIYYYKELYPTAIFYLIMAILAVVAYYKWKKDMRKNNL